MGQNSSLPQRSGPSSDGPSRDAYIDGEPDPGLGEQGRTLRRRRSSHRGEHEHKRLRSRNPLRGLTNLMMSTFGNNQDVEEIDDSESNSEPATPTEETPQAQRGGGHSPSIEGGGLPTQSPRLLPHSRPQSSTDVPAEPTSPPPATPIARVEPIQQDTTDDNANDNTPSPQDDNSDNTPRPHSSLSGIESNFDLESDAEAANAGEAEDDADDAANRDYDEDSDSDDEDGRASVYSRMLYVTATITASTLVTGNFNTGSLHGRSPYARHSSQTDNESLSTFLEELSQGAYVDELRHLMRRAPSVDRGISDQNFFRLFRFPGTPRGIPLLLVGIRGADEIITDDRWSAQSFSLHPLQRQASDRSRATSDAQDSLLRRSSTSSLRSGRPFRIPNHGPGSDQEDDDDVDEEDAEVEADEHQPQPRDADELSLTAESFHSAPDWPESPGNRDSSLFARSSLGLDWSRTRPESTDNRDDGSLFRRPSIGFDWSRERRPLERRHSTSSLRLNASHDSLAPDDEPAPGPRDPAEMDHQTSLISTILERLAQASQHARSRHGDPTYMDRPPSRRREASDDDAASDVLGLRRPGFRDLFGNRGAFDTISRRNSRRRVRPRTANNERETVLPTWVIYAGGGWYPESHPIFHASSLMSDNPTYEDLLLVEELLSPEKPSVISEADLEKVGKRFELTKDHAFIQDEERCPICLADYEEGDECHELNCKHTFHRRCVDGWLLQSRNTCPMCRKDPLAPSQPSENTTTTAAP